MIIVVFINNSCNKSEINCLPYKEKLIDIFPTRSNYLSKVNLEEYPESDTASFNMIFPNNPYCFDESFDLIVYGNNKCVYKGSYSECIEIKIREDIVRSDRVHLFFEILAPISDLDEKVGLLRFNSKRTIIWNSNITFVYACLFPSNQENILFFFPQSINIEL